MTDEEPPASSLHYLEKISSGCGDRVSLSIRWNSARFVVHLDPSVAGSTPEDALIEKYNAACIDEDYDEEEVLSDRILDFIVAAGRQLFDELAPPPGSNASDSSDLHSLLFPPEHTFRCVTQDNTNKLIPSIQESLLEGIEPDHEDLPMNLTIPNDMRLPIVSTKDVRVLEKLLGDGYIAHVLVDGQEMCCKAGDDLFRAESLQRELTTLWKIINSGVADSVRVPKLRGAICTPDDHRVIGILEDYIRYPDSSEEPASLRDIDVSLIADNRRRKWATQVEETILLLHDIGVTWGDAKAANVLIDQETDDVWVIDFGGSWTGGWVDEELSGTVEGDMMGVGKIVEFLGLK